jgi:hypothetical protein
MFDLSSFSFATSSRHTIGFVAQMIDGRLHGVRVISNTLLISMGVPGGGVGIVHTIKTSTGSVPRISHIYTTTSTELFGASRARLIGGVLVLMRW